MYDTLFGTDESLQIKPQMVDRTTVSPDGMKYMFTLRDDLRWHDGQPVLSEDCTESLKRWGKKGPFGQLLMANTAKIAPVGRAREAVKQRAVHDARSDSIDICGSAD